MMYKKTYKKVLWICSLGMYLLGTYFLGPALSAQNEVQAIEYESKDQFYSAIEVWQRVLQQNPNSSRAYYGLARSYMRLERYKEALDFINQAELLASQDNTISLLKSRILMGLGLYDDAKNLLLDLKERSTSPQVDLALAEVFALLGDLATSVRNLGAIQEFTHDNINFLLTSVIIYEEAGDLENANRYLQRALDLYYNKAVVHKVTAGYYLRRGEYERVLEEIDIIRRLGIDTEELRTLGLEAAYLKGDYQLAISQAQTMLKFYPENANAWYLLGLAYNNTKNLSKALEALDTARRIDPSDDLVGVVIAEILRTKYPYPSSWHKEEAQRYIASAKLKRSNLLYDEALQDFRFALQLDPLNRANWMAFSNVFRDRGQYAKYLDKLYAWKNYGFLTGTKDVQQMANTELDKLIAIYEASQHQSVAQKWRLDQYSYNNGYYPLEIFVVKSKSLDYIGAPQELGSYFTNILQWYEQPAVIGEVQLVSDRLAVQQIAHSKGKSDYYLILDFTKEENDFRVEVGLYLSATGYLVHNFSKEKISKGKINSSFSRLASELKNLFPQKAKIVRSTLNRAVLSMGSMEGAELGQKWLLVPEQALGRSVDHPFAEFDTGQVLGTLTLTEVDEKISEGSMQLKSSLRTIKQGDMAILFKEEADNPPQQEAEKKPRLRKDTNFNLQQRLLELS